MGHDDDGFDSPYAKFLDRRLDAVEEILQPMVLDYLEGKPIENYIAQLEEWMGDDWHWGLSDDDRKRFFLIKDGTTYDPR